MTETKNLKFTVTLDEANLILRALSQLPFQEVYELVGKLNQQANDQLGAEGAIHIPQSDN